MRDVLILQPPASAMADQSLHWSVVRDGAVIQAGVTPPGARLTLPAQSVIARAVMLLPCEDVFVRRLPVPGRSERDARRAAPYLIEEQIAQPLDAIEVSLGPVGTDGARWLLAADRTLVQSWGERLAGLNVPVFHALPDGLALGGTGDTLTVMGYGARLVFRTRAGDLQALAEAGQAPRDLDAALADPVCGAMEPLLATRVLEGLGRRLQPRRVCLSAGLDAAPLSPTGAPIVVDRMAAPDLRIAAAAISPDVLEALPTLFGDAFAARIDWAKMLKPWRLAAGLALAAVLSGSALMMGQAAWLEARAARYEAAQEAEFRMLFPEARVVNVRAQMRQALGGVSGAGPDGAGFVALASVLASLLSDVEGVRVDSLRYDASRGELAVTALYSGFGDFERLRQAAEARGAILEDGGARQGAAGVTGDFTVRLP